MIQVYDKEHNVNISISYDTSKTHNPLVLSVWNDEINFDHQVDQDELYGLLFNTTSMSDDFHNIITHLMVMKLGIDEIGER